MRENKYQGYKAIDFLKDDDFLRWNLFKLKEDAAYWKKVVAEHPELKLQVEHAIEMYKTRIRLNDYSLTPEQIELYHDAFHHRATAQKKRKTLYYWLSATAAILLLLAITRIYYHPANQESGLLGFVENNSFSADSLSQDIQLLVSSDQWIRIEEKEPSISYNPDSIQVTGKSVAKVNISEYSQLIVPKGKRSKLTLSDGTMIHINSGTKVVYPNRFADNLREIYVSGEVFLDVAPNPDRPFIVLTNTIEVRVLGTKFNVRSYEEDNETAVVLASGAVQVTSDKDARKATLVPSQMYSYKEGHVSVTKVNVEKQISWIHGILYAENERLDVLMTKLSRYYGEEIIFDENILNQRCSGKVDLKSDLGEVLNGLTFSFPIKVEREDGIYRIRTK